MSSATSTTFTYSGEEDDDIPLTKTQKESITCIIIKSSVIVIKASVFTNWTALQSVIFESPSQLQHIEEEAFLGCKSLLHVHIPPSVTTIDTFAFAECDVLQSVVLPPLLEHLSDGCFSNCYMIESICLPPNIYRIDEWCFISCKGLKKIIIPPSVRFLGERCFEDCTSLKTIEFSDEELYDDDDPFEIEDNCFRGAGLTTINLPNSIKTIDEETFAECKFLTSINLPQSLEQISGDAFKHCESLVTIDFPESLRYIEEEAFQFCNSLIHVKLTETLRTISKKAFANCQCLRSISMSGAILKDIRDFNLTIESEAFTNCPSLRTVELPSMVNAIGDNIFDGCESLASFSLPVVMAKIVRDAFPDMRFNEGVIPLGSNVLSRSSLRTVFIYHFNQFPDDCRHLMLSSNPNLIILTNFPGSWEAEIRDPTILSLFNIYECLLLLDENIERSRQVGALQNIFEQELPEIARRARQSNMTLLHLLIHFAEDDLTYRCRKCCLILTEKEYCRCLSCKKFYYCSTACRETDWSDHQQICDLSPHPVCPLDLIGMLLQKCPETMAATDMDGRTPLHSLLESGPMRNKLMCQLLLRHIHPQTLHKAIVSKPSYDGKMISWDILKLMAEADVDSLDIINDEGLYPFMQVAVGCSGDLRVVYELLSLKPDVMTQIS